MIVPGELSEVQLASDSGPVANGKHRRALETRLYPGNPGSLGDWVSDIRFSPLLSSFSQISYKSSQRFSLLHKDCTNIALALKVDKFVCQNNIDLCNY